MRHWIRRAAVVVATLLLTAPAGARAEQMELHLVLAFDVSASVNDVEFALQRAGTAHALRDDAVARAIAKASGGIAITIVQWSSITRQAMGLDWIHLQTRADVATYADIVAAMPRRLPGGGTMIHAGLEFAERQLAHAPGTARRHVIDLSGNGREDDPDALRARRDLLLARGVVINGLAVEEDDRGLTAYFYEHLIGGPGAFAVRATGWEDFGRAMQIKLLREISGAMFSTRPVPRPVQLAETR